jgi:hypothetical protein
MTVRRGVTLIEALVAIFVCAIGLLSILALFPLGAIKMAQAIQADRVRYAALKASALSEARDLRHDTAYYLPPGSPATLPPTNAAPFDFFINNAVTNAAGLPALNTQAPPQAPQLVSYTGPGYPLFIDPIGVSSSMPAAIGTLNGTTLIARQNVSFVSPGNVAQALYWFSLLDDIEFENDGPLSGLARIGASGTVNRSARYSYAYMLRRPRWWDAAVVDVSVVVYERRPIQASSVEYVYGSPATAGAPGATVTGTNEVTITYSGERPPLRKGSWLLDATVDPMGSFVGNQPNIQGLFYRVTDVSDLSATSVAVQLEQPLRGPLVTPLPNASNQRTFVIMEGVIEVLDRASGWKP